MKTEVLQFLLCLESSPTRIGILEHGISLCFFNGFLEDVERLEYKRVFVQMAIPCIYHVCHRRVWLFLERICWRMADSFWEPVQNWIWSTNTRRGQCFLMILMISLHRSCGKFPFWWFFFPSDRNMASHLRVDGKTWQPKEKSEVKPMEGGTPKAGWEWKCLRIWGSFQSSWTLKGVWRQQPKIQLENHPCPWNASKLPLRTTDRLIA